MATLDGGPRRVSYATPARKTTDSSSPSFDYNDRKASLKEKPSFRDEASSALHRKDDLTKMGDRLKEGKDLLNEDLASKPWLKYIAQRKISRKESAERSLGEDASPTIETGSPNGTFTATPVMASGSDFRTRNLSSLSRSTTSSDYSETSYYEY